MSEQPETQGEQGSVTLTIPAEKLTGKTRLVLDLAKEEARELRHNYVGTEHLLLGLTREGEGIAVGLMRAFGTTLEKVRAQTFQAIALASGGKATEQPPLKSNVVTCRIDGRDLDAVDALIEAGIRSTRSDAAAWLIHAGIEANRPLFEKVYGTVAEIRRLRVVAQSLAQEVPGSGESSAGSTGEQSPF
jgi:ATP-dependent Clp protease ATP-binding subunit ClpA